MLKTKFRLRGWKLPIVAAIGMAFTIVMVTSHPAKTKREPLVTPPQSSYEYNISGIGVVEPKSETISIGVEVPGVVRELNIKVGDNVKKGDVLFSIDQRDIDAQIKTYEAALASAKVQAEDASEQFAVVEKLQDQRAVARDDFNRRKFSKKLAMSKVDEIKAQLDQAKVNKQRMVVVAPIDGQILEVNIRPGEYAPAGNVPSPLIRMGDISTLHVRVEIDEENSARVKAEDHARGFRRGETKDGIELTFVRFEPFVRPKQNLAVAGQRVDTRVLQIIYALPEGQPNVFVGQQMDVFIEEAKQAAEANRSAK